jgi:hypothetical protein
MVLAEELAHLVRGANRSGVGRTAASVHARGRRLTPAAGAAILILALLGAGLAVATGGSAVRAARHGAAHARHAREDARLADNAGNRAVERLGAAAAAHLAPATTPPNAASAALAGQPPLAGRENFAFAPYWTLPQSSTFSITELSTLAYFSIDVTPTEPSTRAGRDGTAIRAMPSPT